MNNKKPIISVRNLTKTYQIGRKREKYKRFSESVTDALMHPGFLLSSSKNNKKSFNALHDISFDVYPGEVVGIIGPNGAGKSTLLKILSGITFPSSGEIELNGRVGSLLEVGTGFHPELTGRENIYFNGSVLGMTRREVDEKFDEIVKFSGIENFLDTPVKRYSSGMAVRLGFAVAAHMDPEILVVDEVLAVGDGEFQKKCLGKMEEVAKAGRTVLFVSHNLSAINRLTDSCIVLNKGQIVFNGPTGKAVDYYTQSISTQEVVHKIDGLVCFILRSNAKAQFIQISVFNSREQLSRVIYYQEHFEIRMQILVNELIPIAYIGFIIENSRGEGIMRVTDDDIKKPLLSSLSSGTYEIRFKMPEKLLPPGKYSLYIFIGPYIDERFNAISFEIMDVESRRAMMNPPDNRSYYDYPVAPEITWEAINISNEGKI
ncbi:ABC transporter ATP-binding protein [Methanospirillum lacunae]|uniref:ABC transporter domain-containing protein n=1 Tax=Methanospirillum lacunae TaxID=668570 RepID=A0A2V2NBB1_9EURY|nr:ABC transporter ATP-binding protein [Methanospirillum lacunae]PWR72861.1 hypothetical protein DK846_07895 [Methanospirillum lacunae]